MGMNLNPISSLFLYRVGCRDIPYIPYIPNISYPFKTLLINVYHLLTPTSHLRSQRSPPLDAPWDAVRGTGFMEKNGWVDGEILVFL